MATVLLIRHGQSSANVAGVLAGWAPDVALTEKGRDQASTLAPVIEAIGPARIVSSPVQRCLETATLLAGALEVQQDDALGECHYGAWTGRPLADLAKDPLWRIIQDAPETPEATFPPSEGYPGESLTQMTARLAAGLSHLDDAVSRSGRRGVGAAPTAIRSRPSLRLRVAPVSPGSSASTSIRAR
jgi:broad specificity phosphatase PhoE